MQLIYMYCLIISLLLLIYEPLTGIVLIIFTVYCIRISKNKKEYNRQQTDKEQQDSWDAYDSIQEDLRYIQESNDPDQINF